MRWLPVAVLVLALAVAAWVVLGITRDDGGMSTAPEPVVSRAEPSGEIGGFVLPDDAKAQLPDVSADESVVDIPIAGARTQRPEWAPTGSLVGRVVSSKGEPLGSAIVDAIAFESSSEIGPLSYRRTRTQASRAMSFVASMGQPDASSTTDMDGRFELRRLPAGTPLALRFAGVDGQFLLREDLAALAGETLDMGDVVVPDSATVLGQVSNASGNELPNVEVVLGNAVATGVEVRNRRGCRSTPLHEGPPPRVAHTAADGTFRFENVAAQYSQIAVFAAGYAMWSKNLSPVPGEQSILDIALQPGLRIAGKTVDEQGRPVAGADVKASAKDHRWSFVACDRSDDKGRFELVDLAADELSLVAVVRRVMSGQAVVVKPGTEDVVLTLKPLPDEGSLTIDVVDSTGGPASGFNLWCTIGDMVLPLGWGDTRQDGQLYLSPWSPQLSTHVWAEAHGCVSATLSLPISDSKEPHIRLQLQPSEPVQGRVVDAVTNAAIPGAELYAQILNDVQLSDDPTWADADGRFHFDNVPPGEVSLRVGAAGHRTTTTRMGAARPHDVDIKLEPAGTLVVDASAAWRRNFGARTTVSINEVGGGRVTGHAGSELPLIAPMLDPGRYSIAVHLNDPDFAESIKLIPVDVTANGVTRVDLSSTTVP